MVRLSKYVQMGVVLCFMALVGCQDSGEAVSNTLEIGIIAPFSGSNEGFGQWITRYVDFATKEINQSGGVLGKRLSYWAVDTKSDSANALEAIRELKNRGVSVVIGPATSASLVEVSGFATQNQIVLISPFATSSEISQLGNYIWRVIPSDSIQGEVAAQHAIENDWDSAAILHVDGSYGEGLAMTFTNTYESLGGVVVASYSYPELSEQALESYDFSPLLENLYLNEPKVVYLVGYNMDGAKITWQSLEFLSEGYMPQFIGCDGNWGDTFLANAHHDIIEGMIFPIPWVDEDDANYKIFKTNSTDYLGYQDTGAAGGALVYDAVYVAAYAMVHSGSEDGFQVKDSIDAVTSDGVLINVNQWGQGISTLSQEMEIDYDGASGPLDFDSNGDVTHGVFELQQIVNGAYQTVDVIEVTTNGALKSKI